MMLNEIGTAVEDAHNVPDTSVEEQLNILHESLDELNNELLTLQDKLSDVMCPTVSQEIEDPSEALVMSYTAERIWAAQTRVKDNIRYIRWLGKSLNIKG